MAALSLHHAIFTNEKDSDLPLRSASPFLHSVPERDGSPTSWLFASAAYQDLIQRQPTHPDGPLSGWDLGLSFFGDPITAAEHKSLKDHQIKMKLRRLHAMSIAFELFFGIWGTYTTVRYCLASADGLGDARRVCALILGVISVLALALVIVSASMPLFPRQTRSHIWRYTRSLLRACYLLLLLAGAMMNLVLILVWHPNQFCNWDIDISWYTSTVNTTTSPCRAAPFAVWTTAAILRLIVTTMVVSSFIYVLRSYHRRRHPNLEGNSSKYSSYFPSDPEDISPVLTSSPFHLSKSTFELARSEDSNRTLNQSSTTLPKSNSFSTLAPSTSCTGYSYSHSTPPPKDTSPPRISPPISRRTSTQINRGTSPITFRSETPSQIQAVDAVTPPGSAPRMLRRLSRIPVTQVTSDIMLPNIPACSDRPNDAAIVRDPSEIQPTLSWRPGQYDTVAHLDNRKTIQATENVHVRHASLAIVGPEPFSSTHDDGESIKEKDKEDDALVYSYGYGASKPTYPYLDMYNPQRPRGCAEASSSCEGLDERGLSRGYRRAIPGGQALAEVSSEPRSSLSQEEEEEESNGEEEEYVAMMGGFVRRMATIESLGSREVAGTVSTTGSVAPYSMRSKTPVSQFSSGRLTEHGSSGASSGMPSRHGSLSTAYLSFSSGGTAMRVNEHGELLLVPNANRSTAGSPHDRQYFTASGSSFPRLDEEHDDR